MTGPKRIPSVPTLSKLLPSGTEGGKEFARIVSLLLFNQAQRLGHKMTIFDDGAGDYEGLDSFSRSRRSTSVIGYQYKFFSSPLSDKHRSEILSAIRAAVSRPRRIKLEKYVLVTPDDLTNSARRKTRGDVDWFEGVAAKSASFEI